MTPPFILKVQPHALGRLPTLMNTYDICNRLIGEKIDGDFVECGVAYGVHPAIMAHVCQERNDGREVHLFDSFCGIPKAGPKDFADIIDSVGMGDGTLVTSGVSACSVEGVKSNMERWGVKTNNMVFHEGWFQDTLPLTAIDKIAYLRLDGDLYDSTMVCLEYLYPRIVRGGFIVIDDYVLRGCRDAVHEYLGRIGSVPVIEHTVDDIHTVAFWRV